MLVALLSEAVSYVEVNVLSENILLNEPVSPVVLDQKYIEGGEPPLQFVSLL